MKIGNFAIILSLTFLVHCQGAEDESSKSSEPKEGDIASFARDDDLQNSRSIRFLSLAIQDAPPSSEDLEKILAGEISLTDLRENWLETPQHEKRILRYFDDLFGVPKGIFAKDDRLFLRTTDEGAYYLLAKGPCKESETEMIDPWWTPSNTTVKICSNSVSDELRLDTDPPIRCVSPKNFKHPDCGCGRHAIFCLPLEFSKPLKSVIREEFSHRGLHAYKNDLSWTELFGGNFVVANKLLYYYYLHEQTIGPLTQIPQTSDLEVLFNLKLDEWSRVEAPNGAQRAGVATSPGFLKRFNNFRSRIRALTERLLCHDVDPSMNLSGKQDFVNPDFSEADLEHGEKQDCAGCHYPLDNLGSMLFGWNMEGRFVNRASNTPYNLSGRSFGVEATGPIEMMLGFTERSPQFLPCMAKTAWEELSDIPFSRISQKWQDKFIEMARAGPRPLIRGIALSEELIRARSKDFGNEAASQIEISFALDVQPVLKKSCAGVECHSSNTTLGTARAFIDSEDDFQAINIKRVTDNTMPPATSGRTISDREKSILVQYLRQPRAGAD